MTMVPDTLEVIIVDEAWTTAGLHLKCCRLDEFYCGAPFHPETEATTEHTEEEACPVCVDMRYDMLCPPARPTHQHCPFTHSRCPK